MIRRKSLLILLVFISSIYVSSANAQFSIQPPTVNIPPTNAYNQFNVSNATISAKNFIASINVVGKNGLGVTGSNSSQTIYLTAPNPSSGLPTTYCPTNYGFISYNATTNVLACGLLNQTGAGSGVTSLNTLTGGLTIAKGTNINSITASGNTITINAAGWQNNTGSNLGTSGTGVFSSMSGSILQFFKLISSNSFLSITSNSTNVIINIPSMVTKLIAGTGISVNQTSGNVLVTNTGVTKLAATSPVIVNASTGSINVSCPTCSSTTGTITGGSNVGTSGFGFFKDSSGNIINLRNLTTSRADLFSITQSANNVNLASSFKSNSITCTNQFISAYNNATGLSTCTSIGGVTQLNNMTGELGIVRGTINNIAITNDTIHQSIKIDIGSNVIDKTTTQTITGKKTIQNPELNGISLAYVPKTSSYTVTQFDTIISVNATAGGDPTIITLPSASVDINQTITIKKIDYGTNSVMIKTTSSQTIDGFNNINITNAKFPITIISDGSNWQTITSTQSSAQDYRIKGTSENRWATSAVNVFTSAGAQSPSATALQAFPYVVTQPQLIDKIQLEVTTLVAGSTCRMGIYNSNSTSYPTTLVSGSDVGTISGASTGVKTNTFSTPIKLKPGLYWLATECSTATTIQIRFMTPASLPDIFGVASTMSSTPGGIGWSATNTFGALPLTYPSGGTILTAINPLEIAVRIIG